MTSEQYIILKRLRSSHTGVSGEDDMRLFSFDLTSTIALFLKATSLMREMKEQALAE